jgi:uncharacterized membrane protein (DUF485 family)
MADQKLSQDVEHSERHNRGIGILLFALYLVVYVGFVGLFAWDYKAGAKVVFGGLNVAIVYGMGLIVGAFVLAVVYMFWARQPPKV